MPEPEDLEQELSEEQAIALLTSEPAAPDEPPSPPAPPDDNPPPPDNREELPSWLASIKPEDRAAVADRFLESLPADERSKLPSVQQMVQGAANYAAQQTEQRLNESANDEARETELYGRATSLLTDIQNDAIEPGDLPTRLSEYGEVAADTRQAEINDGIQETLMGTAKLLGLSSIPGDVIAAAEQAEDWAAAVYQYNRYFVGTAYNIGLEAGKKAAGDGNKADAVADRARLRDEIIAELRAEGRLKDNIPPSLGETVGVGSGRIVIDDNASEDELLAAAAANLAQMKAR